MQMEFIPVFLAHFKIFKIQIMTEKNYVFDHVQALFDMPDFAWKKKHP